jgi:hypothetical protein
MVNLPLSSWQVLASCGARFFCALVPADPEGFCDFLLVRRTLNRGWDSHAVGA